MHDSSDSAGRLWYPKGRPPYIDAAPLLAAEWRPDILSIGLPRGVIGRSGHHPHLVPVIRKPSCHLARVFSDARRFRRKIGAVDQNPHVYNLRVPRGQSTSSRLLQEICPPTRRFKNARFAASYCLGAEIRNGSEMKNNRHEMPRVGELLLLAALRASAS